MGPVRGRVTASEGIGRLEIGGMRAMTTPDGMFAGAVPVMPGMNLVTIDAYDTAEEPHHRKGHRTLLVADLLPEGELNPAAAAVSVSDGMLAGMVAPLAAEVAGLDIAGEIMARRTLSDDDSCTTYPDSARHGMPTLALARSPAGELVLQITIPSLHINFHGTCNVLFNTTNITGTMDTTIVISSVLSAPAAVDGCVTSFDHAPPSVDLRDFDMNVMGGSGLFGSLLVSLGAEMREGDSADMMKAQIAAQAEPMIAERLMGLEVFGEPQMLTMFDTPISLDLCLTALGPEAGDLRARVGAAVTGPGTEMARGAPQVPGEIPAGMPGALTLDANLVAQLVYAAWRAGGIDTENAQMIGLDLLALLAPGLEGRYPRGTMATVSLDATMPPLVRAAPIVEGAPGDLILEIGDLYLEIRAEGDLLFRIGTVLKLTLELVPEMGALRPMVAAVEAEAFLLAEPVAEIDDAALETVVQGQIGDQAAALLGGATLMLPSFGGPLVARDVVPDPGGRYVHILLE
jgi:hypothetical protein